MRLKRKAFYARIGMACFCLTLPCLFIVSTVSFSAAAALGVVYILFISLVAVYARLRARRQRKRGWRIFGHSSSKCYLEWRDGKWRGLNVGHVKQHNRQKIFVFNTHEKWMEDQGDAMTDHRRAEIIAKVKTEFPPSRYTYRNDA